MKQQKFTQIGKRENNEDFLGHNSNTIIVCDGIGGHASGEVASKFIVDNMLELTKKNKEEINKTIIQQFLQTVQNDLNKLLEKNPDQLRMGTTFTALFKTEQAWFAAHIGDSRIYLVRPSEGKIWHTWDHSIVGELMRTNEITRETGRKHPMANQIARAITANKKNKTAKADIVKIDELKKGDLFLLCSDGVNEPWPEHELAELLCKSDLNIQQKTEIIKQRCNEFSKDNNTAYLLEVEEDDQLHVGDNKEITWLSLQHLKDDYQLYLQEIEKEKDDDAIYVENIDVESVNEQPDNVSPLPENQDRKENVEETKKTGTLLKKFIIVVFVFLLGFAVFKMIIPGSDKNDKNDPVPEVKTEIPKIKPDIKNNTERIDNRVQNEYRQWKNSRHTNTINSYKQYLKKYPKGKFASIANDKIDSLKNVKNGMTDPKIKPERENKIDSVNKDEIESGKKEDEKKPVIIKVEADAVK